MLNDTRGIQYAKSRPALPNIAAIIYVAIELLNHGLSKLRCPLSTKYTLNFEYLVPENVYLINNFILITNRNDSI